MVTTFNKTQSPISHCKDSQNTPLEMAAFLINKFPTSNTIFVEV